jgi:thymidine kinase
MALSEKVTKLHAKCDDCSAQGNHTFRKNKSEKLVQIGTKTNYLALCRMCFNKRIKKNE